MQTVPATMEPSDISPRFVRLYLAWLALLLLVAVGVLIIVPCASAQSMPTVQYPGRGASPAPPSPAPTPVVRPPRNCTEARSWGMENIPTGSPYYGRWLDRDNDGIGCESRGSR